MIFKGINNSGTSIRAVEQEVTVTATYAAVIFLLDESGSMSGDNIRSLNDAINRFPKDVYANNTFARTHIEIAVMAFSNRVRLVSDWRPLENYTPVSLSAGGGTNLGSALDAALKKAKAKLDNDRFKTVHIVLISDGEGGSVKREAKEIARMKADGTLVFWMLGVPGYDSATAKELTHGERFYLLQRNKQFDYSDFIRMLASAVVRIQNENNTPTLPEIPGVKRIGVTQSGVSKQENDTPSGGIFRPGTFGGASSNNGSSNGGSSGGGFF